MILWTYFMMNIYDKIAFLGIPLGMFVIFTVICIVCTIILNLLPHLLLTFYFTAFIHLFILFTHQFTNTFIVIWQQTVSFFWSSGSMASYTCISCRVAFADGEVQRAHYKTDWHRYNLKRKVADMPPVTAENFQERVLQQRAAAEQQLSESTATEVCGVCNKRFSSANAHQNHLQSHKHQQAEKQALLAAQRKVEKMNEKNLEKGLGEEKVDHDTRNQALQQALKEQQRPSPAKQTGGQTSQGASKQRTERSEQPPRSMWLEEQVKRREKEEGAPAEEGKEVTPFTSLRQMIVL